jgi:hypothetical protein
MEDNRDPELVSILPDYLDMTIGYNTFKTTIIISIFVILIILIASVSVACYSSNRLQIVDIRNKYDTSKYSRNKLSIGTSRDIGAASTGTFGHVSNGTDLLSADKCESLSYRKWQGGECKCEGSYWGSSCHRELYGADYIDVGNFTPTEELPLISEHYVHDKTFPYKDGNTTCESLCSELNGKCLGFIYTEMERAGGAINKCQLLSEEPEGILTYNPHQDGNLYLHTIHSSGRPKMTNKIILYTGKPIERFWEKENEIGKIYSFANIYFDQINMIHFIPTAYINDSKASVVYHNDHFTKGQAKIMENYFKNEGYQRDGWYVHIPGVNDITPPFTLSKGVVWVMGIHKDPSHVDILKLNKRISEMASQASGQDVVKTHLHSSFSCSGKISEDMSEDMSAPTNPYNITGSRILDDEFSCDISFSNKSLHEGYEEEESGNCDSMTMSSYPTEETLLRSEWSR